MANQIFNTFKKQIMKTDWEDNVGVTIKVMLVTDNYTPDIDLHTVRQDINDIANAESAGTGYTAGGAVVDGRVITIDNDYDISICDANDITWANSTVTARGAIVYIDTGDALTDVLITYVDFVANKSSSSGDFILQWHTDGVYKVA